jgi:hypothetical protein
MVLVLYHHGSSACAAKVRFALAEKALPWESRYVDILRGEQFAPAYLAVNPVVRAGVRAACVRARVRRMARCVAPCRRLMGRNGEPQSAAKKRKARRGGPSSCCR